MKSKKILFAMLLGMLSLTACEDFIDQGYTDTQISRESVFSDPVNAEMRLNNAYGILTKNLYNANLLYTYATNSDVELIDEGKNTKTATNDSKGYMNYVQPEGAKSWNTTTTVWNAFYEEIATCNDIIDGINRFGNPDANEKMRQIRAQAVTLRALMYMEATRIFGDIPLIMEPADADPNTLRVEKYDRDYILDQQLEALRGAIKDLDGFSTDRRHVSKYYAECLFAQIVLQRCGYAIREDVRNNPYKGEKEYCDTIMVDGVKKAVPYVDAMKDDDPNKHISDPVYPTLRPSDEIRKEYYLEAIAMLGDVIENGGYDLVPDVREYWHQVNLRNDNIIENIFEVPVGYNISGDLGSRIGVRLNWATTASSNTFGVGTSGNMKLVLPLYDAYSREKDGEFFCGDLNNDDMRRDITVSLIAVQDSIRTVNGKKYNVAGETLVTGAFGLYVGKWDARYLYTNDSQWREQNLNASALWSYGIRPVRMRYAQVLLYYAELLNELTNYFGISRTDINTIIKNKYNGVELNKFKNPRNAIREVRNRAFGSDQTVNWIENSYQGINEAICDENMREFAGEGFRKWDLIRWNLLVYKTLVMKETFYRNKITSPIYNTLASYNQELYGYEGQDPATKPSRITQVTVYTDSDAPSKIRGQVSGYGKTSSSGPENVDYMTISAGLTGDKVSTKQFPDVNPESGVKNRYIIPLTTTIINNTNHTIENSYGY